MAAEELQIPTSSLVVDDDQVVLKQMVTYLIDAGVGLVEHAVDGSDAWKKIRSRPYDFFILDWKLPDISGMALFNRIRRMRGHSATPVLVVSGMLKREDFRILEEFPCTALLEKPFTRALLLKKVSELTREFQWYSSNIGLVDDLMDLISSKPGEVTAKLTRSVLPGAPNPIPLGIMAARKLREAGSVENAARLLQQILAISPQNISAMTEIGKILHLTGNHKEALVFLNQANLLSPSNISRLCLMGGAELNLCNPESAAKYFRAALGVDGQDKTAREGFSVAKEIVTIGRRPDSADIPKTFASLLNVMAISLVRSGSYNDGIKKYHEAMRFLHLSQDSAKLAFNLGLGFLRWNKPKEAHEWFYKSAKLGGSSYMRAGTYLAKLERYSAPESAGSNPKNLYVELPRSLIEAAQAEDFEEEMIINSSAGNPHLSGVRPRKLENIDASLLATIDEDPVIDESVLADLADLESGF